MNVKISNNKPRGEQAVLSFDLFISIFNKQKQHHCILYSSSYDITSMAKRQQLFLIFITESMNYVRNEL